MNGYAQFLGGRVVVGTIAIVAGILTALATSATPSGNSGAYVVATLLVLAGVGRRVEAAILQSRVPPKMISDVVSNVD